MIISSRAPARVDFAGAWTDVRYFANSFGGATTNAAIDRFVTGRSVVGNLDATTMAQQGIQVSYQTDIPAGSGLGTSSALNVVWLSLARGKMLQDGDRARIAEQAYEVESVLGIIGGKQDHYASACGGFNLFEFEEKGVRINRIDMDAGDAEELAGLLVLAYTGQARLSSRLHERVWGGFRAGKREVVESLFTLRDSAYQAAQILHSRDWSALGPLLNVQHECACHLDASLTNDRVEELRQLVQPWTLGSKCCGAGGGGCMLFLCETPELRERTVLRLIGHGVHVIPFQFAMEGLTVEVAEG